MPARAGLEGEAVAPHEVEQRVGVFKVEAASGSEALVEEAAQARGVVEKLIEADTSGTRILEQIGEKLAERVVGAESSLLDESGHGDGREHFAQRGEGVARVYRVRDGQPFAGLAVGVGE